MRREPAAQFIFSRASAIISLVRNQSRGIYDSDLCHIPRSCRERRKVMVQN